MPSAVAAKPPPQVATRPRRVVERKPGEKLRRCVLQHTCQSPGKTPGKTSDDSRGATSPKDKPTANKDNEKKSAEKADPKNAGKKPASQAEIKTIVKQRETAGAQQPKSLTPRQRQPFSQTFSDSRRHACRRSFSPQGRRHVHTEVCAGADCPGSRQVQNTVRQRFKLGGEPTKFCNGSH